MVQTPSAEPAEIDWASMQRQLLGILQATEALQPSLGCAGAPALSTTCSTPASAPLGAVLGASLLRVGQGWRRGTTYSAAGPLCTP